MRCIALLAVASLVVVACSSSDDTATDDAEIASSTEEALSAGGAVSRAEEWVAVKLHYCQAPYGARDYDAACPSYCKRQSNTKWNPYRSDCSGFVSWAWNLPAPGRVTSQFAPFRNDITHTITASQLRPGDAVNNSSHVMLFKGWLVPGKRAAFLEEPGCSSSKPYARETISDVSMKGSSIHVDAHGATFTAIRYGGLTADPAPQPPAPLPLRGTLDAVTCDGVKGSVEDPNTPKAAIDAVVAFGAPVDRTTAHVTRVATTTGHAFAVDLPLGLRDGKAHPVYAYATNGKTRVPIGDKTITCAPPAPPKGTFVRRRVAKLDAWSLDAWEDVAREPSGTASSFADGPELPAKPVAVKSDDGSPAVWVVDGGYRRHVVDPASLAAWKLSVVKWTAADVAALDEGPAWPEEPFAFEAAGTSDVFVLDVPLPSGSVATAPPKQPSQVTPTSDAEGDPGAPPDDESASSRDRSGMAGTGGCSTTRAPASGDLAILGLAIALACARRRAFTAR